MTFVDKRCQICDGTNFGKRNGKVRDNPEIEVLECQNCGLVFLSSDEYITNAFYENSQMHEKGIENNLEEWIKNTAIDDDRRYQTYSEMIKNKDILDFGCGTGGFLLRAREKASKVYGIELEKSLKKHFESNDLDIYHDLDSFDKTVDYIFMFHVLEHIKNPFEILEKMKSKLKPGGQIIAEVPNSDDVLLTLYNNKVFSEFTYWSAHLYLYNATTLNFLAKKAGLKTIAIKQEQRYPLSNHLYWLSQAKPGGHLKWQFLNSPELEAAYKNTLASIGKCDTIVGYLTPT